VEIRVLNYDECAARAGIVRRTFERQIEAGQGPAVVEITSRRRGVLESDFAEWLLARRRPVRGAPAPERRGPGRPRKSPAA
jgi:predicted DNA-binding transcriptional regulator AlpA